MKRSREGCQAERIVNQAPGSAKWRIMEAMANGLTYRRQTTSAEATKQLASTLVPYLHAGDTIVLNGDLGAGKTQFAQGLAAGLGVTSQVTSPTYNILLSYAGDGILLYHFDLYRLDNASQLEEVGFYDVMDGPGVTLIEWGDKFPEALPFVHLDIDITIAEDGTRHIKVHSFGERARNLLFVWAKDSKSRLMKVR